MITYYLGRKHVRADLPMAQGNVRHRYRRRYGMDDDSLIRYAEQSLTRPDSFAYFGDLDLFRTWGMGPLAQSRDSGALERSNYRRVLEDMTRVSPEFVTDFSSSHWAVGWVEQILVRVLYDPDEDVTPDNITGAFRMLAEIADFLRTDYPVYDEPDYSELEHEEASEYFESEWSSMLRHWDEQDDGPEPSETEKDSVWSDHDLMYPDNAAYDDKLKGYVLEMRAERIKAAKRIAYRLLGKP